MKALYYFLFPGFKGRMGRARFLIEFGITIGFCALIILAELSKHPSLRTNQDVSISTILQAIFCLYRFACIFTIRCHDLGKSGWATTSILSLLWLIPTKGQEDENEYGPKPDTYKISRLRTENIEPTQMQNT